MGAEATEDHIKIPSEEWMPPEILAADSGRMQQLHCPVLSWQTRLQPLVHVSGSGDGFTRRQSVVLPSVQHMYAGVLTDSSVDSGLAAPRVPVSVES